MNDSKLKKEKNPLGLDAKREKSGSDTFRKYNYQYHWAFCRMLDEHSEGNEYAIFVEEHEDVTISDSLDVKNAKFEFNQIKEVATKYTIDNLTNDKVKTDSPIKKLAKSVSKKEFSPKVSEVNFVSTGGFSFDLHKQGFSFEVIQLGELSDDEKEKIDKCITGIDKSGLITEKLAFIIPELPAKGFDLAVEGKISKLLNELSPGGTYNSSSIYSCVIRDLERKGENKFDYQDWNTSLKKKAITSRQLSSIISRHINTKPDESLMSELFQILSGEYQLPSLKRRKVRSAFMRYYTSKLSSRDRELNEISNKICDAISDNIDDFSTAHELEDHIYNNSDSNVKNYFQSREDFSGAFLYELVKTS